MFNWLKEKMGKADRDRNGSDRADEPMLSEEEILRLIEDGKEAEQNGNFEHAVSLYRRAAGQGNPEGQYCLALLYLEGKGIKKNEKTAAEWLQKAVDQEHKPAMKKLAWCYLYAHGTKQSLSTALELSQKADDTECKVDMNKFGALVRK